MSSPISRAKNNGYVLVATLVLGMALALVSVTFMQNVVTSSVELNEQSYRSLASEAAEAGSIYASSCIGLTEIQWTTLTPNTACNDSAITGAPSYIGQSSGSSSGFRWENTFSVDGLKKSGTTFKETSTNFTYTTKGKVIVYQGTTAVATYESLKTTRIDKINQVINQVTSTRNAITDLSSDTHSCIISNGQLYCWGANAKGQLGDGTVAPKNTPTLITTFSGKMVTKVAVGTENTCAIADAKLYCWGDNANGQIGASVSAPVKTPTVVAGLSTRKITDIAVSQGATGTKSACAITDGIVYCWGSNNNQQLGQSSSTVTNTTDYSTPQPVYGYRSSSASDSPMRNKKATSVSVGKAGACAIADGKEFCWGGISVFTYPFNYSDYGDYAYAPFANYDSAKVVGDTACTTVMIPWLMCHGSSNTLKTYNPSDPNNPTVSLNIYPRLVTNYTIITGMDGGASGTDEQYCIINLSQPYCQGTSNTGTNDDTVPPPPAYVDNPQPYFKMLTAKNLNNPDFHIATTYNKTTTHIGVGNNYGCLVASSELFCWGTDTNGTLADGVASGTKYYYPTHVASGTIGFNEDAFAADGPITMGKNHGCAIVNSTVLCWGANDKGQLGNGNNVGKNQPTSVYITVPGATARSFIVSSKVSAGGDHTCSISALIPFCWGSNTNGELGIGSTTAALKPTEVTYFRSNNMAVTDISAGPSGTCAVANGELYCWGNNDHSQVGNSSATVKQLTPLKVTALAGKLVTAISVGATHTCAIANGDAYCWGENGAGQLGRSPYTDQASAIKIPASGVAMASQSGMSVDGAAFTAISAGTNYTCGIVNGLAACWGDNTDGKLGSTAASRSVPTLVTELSGMQTTSISAGDRHACAVVNGKTYCWGNQQYGKLGDNTSTNTTRASPSLTSLINGNGGALTAGLNSRFVAASSGSSCSTANGLIFCWGNNDNDQLANGDETHANRSQSVVSDKYRYIYTNSRGPLY